jgi:Putative Ig domain
MPIIPNGWKPLLKEVWSNMTKAFLLVYFIVVACLAAYLTCTLWLATPNENPPDSTNISPGCMDKPGDPPQITRLDPDSVAIGENYANVAVYGCNLKGDAKVRFNGLERQTSAAGANELIVPLQSSDFAAPGNIAVRVETQGTKEKDSANKALFSNVLNLRVKPTSDLKAVWLIWGGKKEITLELRLILLVLFAGALSASVSGLKSFVDYTGDKKFDPSWYWFYYAEPFLGSGLAFIFYLVIRAGFLAGTSADVKAINPFGFVAVAALVGMFSDAAFRKLNEVFDTLFKVAAKDTRSGKLSDLTITSPASLPPATHGQPYTFSFEAKGGTPAYTWTAMKNPPGGLTLSGQGVLSGTPVAAVPETGFTIQVTDSTGATTTKECKLTIQ